MDNLQYYGFLFLAYILSGMQSVSGCVTQQFVNGNTALELSCPITSFTGPGIWSVDGSQMTNCNSGGFCNTITNGNYKFTSNSSGIYIMINPYMTTEVGKNWTCNHLQTYCSIIVEPPSESPTLQTSTLLATERTTSFTTILEYNNITTSMIIGDITSTRYISTSTMNKLNTETTILHVNTESSNSYTNTETTNSNTETTNFNANTGTSNSYANTETTSYNANNETTNFYVNTETSSNFFANTETKKIDAETLGIVSMSTFQSMFVKTAANDISRYVFSDTIIKKNTEMLSSTGYSVFLNDETKLPSTFETIHFLSRTFSETTFSYAVDTQSDNLFYSINVSSDFSITKSSSLSMTLSPSHIVVQYIATLSTHFSVPSLAAHTLDSALVIPNVSHVSSIPLITGVVLTSLIPLIIHSNTVLNSESLLMIRSVNNSHLKQVITSTESPWVSTQPVVDQIYDASNVIESSFSCLSVTTVTLPKISVSSQLPSIIDTMNHFIYTTNTLITSFLDDTRHSFDDFTDGFKTFSQNYAASASTSFAIFSQSTNHHLSLQTSEYYVTMQPEFTSYVTTPLYESHTDNAATGIYSKEIVTSGKSYMHTGLMPSQTQLASMNDIQDSTTDFQSTYFEPDSRSNDEGFSSEISENLLSTLQSTSLLLPFNTQSSASEGDSYMETTNMLTFESQSGIPTKDLSLFTNPSSIQISTVFIDFKPTLLTTAINVNSKTMPSMIKPSSKQTNSGISYIEIETSFKDSLFPFDSFSGSVKSNDQDLTSLSSGVYKSIRPLSTNTIQSGLSEKNKTIIFITTTSAVIVIIVVILLIIFAKVYMSKNIMKPRKEDDNISWSNKSSSPKAAFPAYSFTGKSIYPLLNTSSVSFKMFPYEHHWNDIV